MQIVQARFAAAANDAAAGDVAWSSPSNALISDDTYTSAAMTAGQSTNYLKPTDIVVEGADLASGDTINEIEVSVECDANAQAGAVITDAEIKLIVGGTIGGTSQNNGQTVPISDHTKVLKYRASPTAWGFPSLTISQAQASDFGVALRFVADGSSRTMRIDQPLIRFYVTRAAAVVLTAPTITPMAPCTLFAHAMMSGWAGYEPRDFPPSWNWGEDGVNQFNDPIVTTTIRDIARDTIGYVAAYPVLTSGGRGVDCKINYPDGSVKSAVQSYTVAADTRTYYYVAAAGNGGSDSNDGLTTSTPKLTFGAAADLVAADNRGIIIRGGDTVNGGGASFTSRANLVVRSGGETGWGSGRATINRTSGSTLLTFITCTEVWFSGINLTGSAGNTSGFNFDRCERCTVRNVTGSGLALFILSSRSGTTTSKWLAIFNCDGGSPTSYTLFGGNASYVFAAGLVGLGSTNESVCRMQTWDGAAGVGFTLLWSMLDYNDVALKDSLRNSMTWSCVRENKLVNGCVQIGYSDSTLDPNWTHTLHYSGNLIIGGGSSANDAIKIFTLTDYLHFSGNVVQVDDYRACITTTGTGTKGQEWNAANNTLRIMNATGGSGFEFKSAVNNPTQTVDIRNNLFVIGNLTNFGADGDSYYVSDNAASATVRNFGGNVYGVHAGGVTKWRRANVARTFAQHQADTAGASLDVQQTVAPADVELADQYRYHPVTYATAAAAGIAISTVERDFFRTPWPRTGARRAGSVDAWPHKEPTDDFTFYNTTFYAVNESPLTDRFPYPPLGTPTLPLAVCWDFLGANVAAPAMADPTKSPWLAIFNFEPIIDPAAYQGVTDPTTIQSAVEFLDQVIGHITKTKRDYPGLQVGSWAYPRRLRINVSIEITRRVKILNDLLSVSCPSVYRGVAATDAEWLATLQVELPQYQKFGKPIIPFINPSSVEGGTDQPQLGVDKFAFMCQTLSSRDLFPYLSGAAVWGGWYFHPVNGFSRRTLSEFGNTYLGIAQTYHRGKLFTF